MPDLWDAVTSVGRGRGGMVRGRGVGLEMGPTGVGQMVGAMHGMVGQRVPAVGVVGGQARFGQYPATNPHSRGIGTRLGARASVPAMGGAHRVTNGNRNKGINPGNSLQARER